MKKLLKLPVPLSVLVTGETCSGKATLLSSIMRTVSENVNGNRKILTYEPPIEYIYDEVEKPSVIFLSLK